MRGLKERPAARAEARRQWSIRSDTGTRSRVLGREQVPGNAGTKVAYDALVATGEVNRAEWAAIVRALVAEHTRGKKATFARKVGVDPKTIDNWLKCEVRVSEESIRQVAAAIPGASALEWLIMVGYYEVGELPVRMTDEQIDEEQRYVLDRNDLDDETKAEILQQLDAMRSTDDAWIQEQQERNRVRRQQQIDHLIEQARRSA